jgi:hypothetical protein
VILATTFFMSHGARNWPFLTFTGLPVFAGGDQQVGLAAEEGRDLQHVDRLRDRAHCALSCTSVSTGRPRCLANVGEDRQRRLKPEAARAAEVRLALSNEVL